jgi:hypothetical protein
MTFRFALLALVALVLGYLLAACMRQPTQPECAKLRDCRGCVTANCGWCTPDTGTVGCFTLNAKGPCFRLESVAWCTDDPTSGAGEYGVPRRVTP